MIGVFFSSLWLYHRRGCGGCGGCGGGCCGSCCGRFGRSSNGNVDVDVDVARCSMFARPCHHLVPLPSLPPPALSLQEQEQKQKHIQGYIPESTAFSLHCEAITTVTPATTAPTAATTNCHSCHHHSQHHSHNYSHHHSHLHNLPPQPSSQLSVITAVGHHSHSHSCRSSQP